MSGQPCGCDPEAAWVCMWHRCNRCEAFAGEAALCDACAKAVTRRDSDGQVRPPAVPDPRSYDERIRDSRSRTYFGCAVGGND